MTDEQLIVEIRSWIGTRWMHGQAVKGVGVDCIQFVVAVAKAAGWLPDDFSAPAYNVDHAMHSDVSVLLEGLEQYCVKVPKTDIRPGDILAFHYGRCASHVGFYIGNGRMVHSHIRHGVSEMLIQHLSDRLNSAWRFPRG